MGVRGSGKTVAVTEIEDRAASDGWLILSLDASSSGLLERIQDEVGALPDRYPDLDLSKLGNPKTVEKRRSVNLGPLKGGASETESRSAGREMGLRRQLTYLAEQARKHGTSVLLTVDELHAIDRDEGRRLSNDLQHITRRGGLPLAFIGAGLSEMKYTVMQDKKMTFFRRCEEYDMPPLSEADATKGLLHPIQDSGGDITDDALRQAVGSVGASPFKLQLIGHMAWTIANAPKKTIDSAAVSEAARLAQKKFDEKISEPAFYDLSESEQRYLIGLVDLGGEGRVSDIARQCGHHYETAKGINRRLMQAGYLDYANNVARLTELVPERVIVQESGGQHDEPGIPSPIHVTPRSAEAGSSSANASRCRKWMPRKKAHCVLAKDHSGNCRSR